MIKIKSNNYHHQCRLDRNNIKNYNWQYKLKSASHIVEMYYTIIIILPFVIFELSDEYIDFTMI